MQTEARDMPVIEKQLSGKNVTDEETVIYPNPASNQITVSLYMNKAGSVNLLINDLTGKNLLNETKNVGIGRQEITIENLKAKGLKTGVYILKVLSNAIEYNVKLIVE